MSYPSSASDRTSIIRNPVYAALAPFPFVCFILALATDIAYVRTSNVQWQNFSAWLLFVGLLIGALAAIAGAVDLVSRREMRDLPIAWIQAALGLIVLLLALLNSFVHARDGWTAVMWQGLALSLATVVVLIIAAALGRIMIHE
jgi:uncharacterized membrane protein